MVPMVETREQAEAIVRGCRYPNLRSSDGTTTTATTLNGTRGAGGMFAHHAFPSSHPMSASGRAYWQHANTEIIIIAQIESALAVANIEAIASTPGLDALFIGPNDLAASMGYVPFEHGQIQEVQDAIARVLKVGNREGKYMGCFALGADEAARRWEEGWDFVNCGADLVALAGWMGSEMGKLGRLVMEGKETGN
ncbi:4-hydroxy-2-oxovalerate aldolase [Cyphellophora attinorum]|uniref:4-hydroxy-2-oxovalerate aldolase n=1 Tax=Cyphellophora attinorum TaxID=1664694 RepID=A0A0N0NP80_9EURO|nr:4-hydroxy-2-oxovalerate aldolase [Phialophora attinorum]KPI42229.1 4-hydroxy-2-oxovalerate aldolase [Phialophora attinorum]